jgi:hypothetical protein
LLEKTNINKLLVKPGKRRREMTLINKIKDEKGAITAGTNEIQKTIRKYFEYLYSNRLANLEEINKFLDISYLSKLSRETINHINRHVKIKLKQY